MPNRSLFIPILSLYFLLVFTKLKSTSTNETDEYFKTDVKDRNVIEKMMERKTEENERRVVVGILA